jgi:hypothetical protein
MTKPADLERIKSATFRGKRYRMIWRKPRDGKQDKAAGQSITGWCDNHETKHRAIRVATSGRSNVSILDIVIHEALHACFPDADEVAVSETSNSIMALLVRMGIQVEFKPGHPPNGDWTPAVPQP